jgi:hypothetical protein
MLAAFRAIKTPSMGPNRNPLISAGYIKTAIVLGGTPVAARLITKPPARG